VIGLAPIRPGLKIRLRELLCIHGLKEWSPKLASHQRLLGFNEALICLSYSGGWHTATIIRVRKWSSWQVTLLRLPVISRALCF
jgi:hypothetical protein